MPKIRCQFCHEYIDRADYPAHRREHLQLRADGQQSEYATLAPEERDQGSLDEVPQVYIHRRCGAQTGMPEEIIRSYLQNPYLYSADATFCTGCGAHVPFRECTWTETGENLQKYMDRLRAEKPEMKPRFTGIARVGVALLGVIVAGAICLKLLNQGGGGQLVQPNAGPRFPGPGGGPNFPGQVGPPPGAFPKDRPGFRDDGRNDQLPGIVLPKELR